MKGTNVSKYHGQSGNHYPDSVLVIEGGVEFLHVEAVAFEEGGILEDDLVFTFDALDENGISVVRNAYPFANANWPHKYVAFKDKDDVLYVFNAMFLKKENSRFELKSLDEVIGGLEHAKQAGTRCGDVRAADYRSLYFW